MSKTTEDILAPKPEARPRIYAYMIEDKAHKGIIKVGQTTRDVKQRVAEQLKTASPLPLRHRLITKALPFIANIMSNIIRYRQNPEARLDVLMDILNIISETESYSYNLH